MREHILILVLNILLVHTLKAQTLRNFGDMEIHNNGQMGFYSSLENDGLFNNASGLVGFYGSFKNSISGSITPLFYDVEIFNEHGVSLEIPIEISNNTNFVLGDLITSKEINSTFLKFISTSLYNGESHFSKVNGYVAISNVQKFMFPIGDETYLRPLAIETESKIGSFKSAYFFENGTVKLSNTIKDDSDLILINNIEYWVLEGDTSALITIGWNERSELQNMTNDLSKLTVIGYDKELKHWSNLGSVDCTGSLEDGFITSGDFIPNRYNAITFGVLKNKNDVLHKGYHYLVTPNGDGINDFLYIPELENYESNELFIFARNGLKVFEQVDYFNEFGGDASFNIQAINRDSGLPEGIYFYLINVGEDNLPIQGFLYLDR